MAWWRDAFDNLRSWLSVVPVKVVPPDADSVPGDFVQTGPDLVARIVRSIELGQSVILSGPRGCGKSHCVFKAIEIAGKRGILVPNSEVFLQGNRETPRDYLNEDEIGFQTRMDGQRVVVEPTRRYAPLFAYAERDPVTDAPVRDREGVVRFAYFKDRMQPWDRREPISRFVLFLDEVNRFSDGVLDSLLSVLEEKKTVLGGVTYHLPVVVLMTMNPPGYDSSARKLSPPLAARISRGWRLSSPDIDTMADLIIADRWRKAAREYDAAHIVEAARSQFLDSTTRQRFWPALLELLAKTSHRHEAQGNRAKDGDAVLREMVAGESATEFETVQETDARTGDFLVCRLKDPHRVALLLQRRGRACDVLGENGEERWTLDEKVAVRRWRSTWFPPFDAKLVRLAALVSLCLWGDERRQIATEDDKAADGKLTKSGHEYLTVNARKMIRDCQNANARIDKAMQDLNGLTRFGPDGRAAADWVMAALGKAVDDAESRAVPAVLKYEHLRLTAVEALSHKIYDSFNAATAPEKVALKEAIIMAVVFEVFHDNDIVAIKGVLRKLDDDNELTEALGGIAKWYGNSPDRLREALMSCGLRADDDLERLKGIFEARQGRRGELEAILVEAGVLVRRRSGAGPAETGFASRGDYRQFLEGVQARMSADCAEAEFAKEIKNVLDSCPATLRGFHDELGDRETVSMLKQLHGGDYPELGDLESSAAWVIGVITGMPKLTTQRLEVHSKEAAIIEVLDVCKVIREDFRARFGCTAMGKWPKVPPAKLGQEAETAWARALKKGSVATILSEVARVMAVSTVDGWRIGLPLWRWAQGERQKLDNGQTRAAGAAQGRI